VGPALETPTDVVRHLLAVQSQDYPGAKWAVAQRVAGNATDADLDAMFDTGAFVRTHVMRPTWHFVAAEDIRWLLALTAPRVHQANAFQYRQLELDLETRKRSRAVIQRVLEGGRSMLRDELAGALADAGVLGTRLRLGYMIIDAELEAIVCNGPRRGKRQTYALVDERIPPSRPRERDEALAELATRYVRGHGPAQDVDLAWWAGLTVREARQAFDVAGTSLQREEIGGRTFWTDPGEPGPRDAGTEVGSTPPTVRLLPNYDELLVAFRDRTDAMDPALPPPARVAAEILAHVVVRDGLVVGGWRRKDGGASTAIAVDVLVGLTSVERAELWRAIGRLAAFFGRPIEVSGLD
jgi:DNA glycosylase AlkZ-like